MRVQHLTLFILFIAVAEVATLGFKWVILRVKLSKTIIADFKLRTILTEHVSLSKYTSKTSTNSFQALLMMKCMLTSLALYL